MVCIRCHSAPPALLPRQSKAVGVKRRCLPTSIGTSAIPVRAVVEGDEGRPFYGRNGGSGRERCKEEAQCDQQGGEDDQSTSVSMGQ
jgi:hypothetical protein